MDTLGTQRVTTTDENDGVLLKIVTLTTDVGDDLVTVSKTNLGNFPKSGVWLLWGAGVNLQTNTATLGTVIQSR